MLLLPAGEALSKVRGERDPGAGPEGGMQPGREPRMGGGCGGDAGILRDAAPGAPLRLGPGSGALAGSRPFLARELSPLAPGPKDVSDPFCIVIAARQVPAPSGAFPPHGAAPSPRQPGLAAGAGSPAAIGPARRSLAGNARAGLRGARRCPGPKGAAAARQCRGRAGSQTC